MFCFQHPEKNDAIAIAAKHMTEAVEVFKECGYLPKDMGKSDPKDKKYDKPNPEINVGEVQTLQAAGIEDSAEKRKNRHALELQLV